ncbi:MAG TPA: DUF11 domain-containing protein [Isosphaeraceae bacterium]|jgi:uncharacterized repeat protein (TIGR01451 family)|nr:DUF11 domain-containing protein [Isosphaeraceae bacterium]
MPSLRPLVSHSPSSSARPRTTSRGARRRLVVEALERRTVLSVSVLNNAGSGYSALSFNQSGGYVPPDTDGAAGPSAYVETVNQSVALYTNKATGAGAVTDSLGHFLFTTGGLSRADSRSGQSDPIVIYDESIGRFIIGDQDVDFNTHVSAFDLAVSKSSNPTTLSASDWTFYKVNTTQTGEDADYPGNFGYNADAFVYTLNMFAVAGTSGTYHVQVVSISAADLMNAVASPHVYQNNLADFSVRPATMHGSSPGDPMWLVTEHGDNQSIDVYKMTNVLSTSPTFAVTNLAVTPYSQAVAPKNPNGTSITTNIDSRIMKAAEANNTLVATHTVAASSTQDVAQWYAINLGSGTPTLAQQGRVAAGNNTYLTYPGIDINASGAIGMSYIRQGNDSSSDYMSMYVTGRVAGDTAGTMETPVLVPSGTGQANYTDFANPHREGDLSGINVDPSNGTFWAANEFANTEATANWGTAVANFSPSAPANSADVGVTTTGPSSITAGTDVTYTVTVTNSGPNAAAGVVLTDTLPAGSVFVSMTPSGSNPDSFTSSQSGGTATETAAASIASGSTDTFTLVVSAPSTLSPGSNFSNTAAVTSTTADPNTANNTSTAAGTIVGPAADLAVTASGPSGATEGDSVTYTINVTNTSTSNSGTGVVLTDTLGANLSFVSATTPQGSFSQSGAVVTFSLGTLAPGATATLTVTARATEDGSTSDSATVSSSSSDPNSSNNTAAVATTVAEAIIVVSGPITTTQKSPSNLAVATFTHANGLEPAGAFTATINWGDGKTSTGTITLSGTTYTVTGSHRYRRSGTYTITTTVNEVTAAAQLLLAKLGDEQPDLPPHIGPGHGPSSSNGRTDQFASLVDAFLSQGSTPPDAVAPTSPIVTLADLQTSFTLLLDAGSSQGVSLPLSTLVASLGSRNTSNPRVVDALLLIGDLTAQHGD